MSSLENKMIAQQTETIASLMQENINLKREIADRDETIKNLKGGIKAEESIEGLHYEHWVDRTLKKRGQSNFK